MSVAELRAGLAANLDALDGLQVPAGGYVLAQPTTPSVEIVPAPVEYDKAGSRGTDQWTFYVRVLVGTPSDVGGQKKLDKFMEPTGATSVKAALESDTTLGGAALDLWVGKCSGYRVYQREGAPAVLGAEWTVTVYAEGNA